MKIVLHFAVYGLLFSCGNLVAHLQKEEGLFYQYVRHALAEKSKKREHDVEKKQDGVADSTVTLIHGQQAFNRLVIAQSYQQPVVIKLFSQQSIDSIKVRPVYQEVAELLGKEVGFTAMDIIENNDVFVQLMASCKLSQTALPLFLFYKEGHLYTPDHEPAPMVQGYLTKENLESFIKYKFAVKGLR